MQVVLFFSFLAPKKAASPQYKPPSTGVLSGDEKTTKTAFKNCRFLSVFRFFRTILPLAGDSKNLNCLLDSARYRELPRSRKDENDQRVCRSFHRAPPRQSLVSSAFFFCFFVVFFTKPNKLRRKKGRYDKSSTANILAPEHVHSNILLPGR